MMEDRDLAEILNANKDIEQKFMDHLDLLIEEQLADPRAAAIARTQMQTGFMWLNRAVSCRPEAN